MLHISRYSSIFDSAIIPDSGLEDVSNVIIKLIPGIIFPAMYLDIFLEALREYCGSSIIPKCSQYTSCPDTGLNSVKSG